MLDLESKRKKYDRIIKVIIPLGLGLVFGPITILAVSGLVGLVFAWLVSQTVICFTPWMSMKFANWRLAAIKHEASKNPIETMENEYGSKVEMLTRMKESIRVFYGTVKGFYGKLEGFKREFPNDAKSMATCSMTMPAVHGISRTCPYSMRWRAGMVGGCVWMTS